MSWFVRGLGCLLFASCLSCSATSPAYENHPAPGVMPAGARWRGLYQGPYHIMLNVWTHGNRANGNWRAVGDRQGEFTGEVRGNLLLLSWTEHASAGSQTLQGRGYFVYGAGGRGHPDQVFGEWGVGQHGPLSPWFALKRASDPLGSESGQIDADADQQYRDDSTACEIGSCENDSGL
jgi:hypothetical protein